MGVKCVEALRVSDFAHAYQHCKADNVRCGGGKVVKERKFAADNQDL